MLGVVIDSQSKSSDESEIQLRLTNGNINADLTIGTNVSAVKKLKSNTGLCGQGVKLVGDGFLVDNSFISNSTSPETQRPIVRRYVGPQNILKGTTARRVIDFFGLSEDQARAIDAAAFQRIFDRVKPSRDLNRRDSIRELWWRFAWERPELRAAIKHLPRYFVTLETSKFRYFVSVDAECLWDGSLFAIALSDFHYMGVLSSRIHTVFALATGSDLGGNTPRYNKGVCFDPFPFPDCPEPLKARIRELGEQLDAHRKRQQASHPKLTMTDMYNVLEKLRSGEELSAKEKKTHEEGLVSVLKQIHDDLDAAVFEAYGWPSTLSDEEILERLVALNAERHAEEERGLIRWLRPEFQKQAGGTQQGLALEEESAEDEEAAPPKKKGAKAGPKKAAPKKAAKRAKEAWPKTRALRTKGVQSLLAEGTPLSVAEIVKRFSRADEEQIEEILEALVLLGQAHYRRGKYSA